MKKIKYILAGTIILLVLARLIAPSILLKKLNQTLAQLEGPFCGELEDFDLAIIRGAYRLEGLKIRKWSADHSQCERKILSVQALDISLAWSQLFRGKARLRLKADSPEIMINSLLSALAGKKNTGEAKKGAEESWDALIPWRIDSLRIQNGKASYQLFGDGGITAPLENVEGEVTGIETGSASGEPILFRAKGNVFGDSPLLVAGSVALAKNATRWETDFSARSLNLQKANPFLYNRLPMTFTTGQLNIFGEAAGKGAEIEGYARLLFSDIDVVSKKERWKNFEQGVIELVSSLFFSIAENSHRDTVATELVFRNEGGKMNLDWAGALARALQHNAGNAVPAGIDNRLELPN